MTTEELSLFEDPRVPRKGLVMPQPSRCSFTPCSMAKTFLLPESNATIPLERVAQVMVRMLSAPRGVFRSPGGWIERALREN